MKIQVQLVKLLNYLGLSDDIKNKTVISLKTLLTVD